MKTNLTNKCLTHQDEEYFHNEAQNLRINTPRQARFIQNVLYGPCLIKALRNLAGSENIWEEKRLLVEMGWDIRTIKQDGTDRDGSPVRIGFYQLASHQRKEALQALDRFYTSRKDES